MNRRITLWSFQLLLPAITPTRDFRETIRERAQQEPLFRKGLLREAVELMLSGDEKTGRAILRNYINATVSFRRLEEALGW